MPRSFGAPPSLRMTHWHCCVSASGQEGASAAGWPVTTSCMLPVTISNAISQKGSKSLSSSKRALARVSTRIGHVSGMMGFARFILLSCGCVHPVSGGVGARQRGGAVEQALGHARSGSRAAPGAVAGRLCRQPVQPHAGGRDSWYGVSAS